MSFAVCCIELQHTFEDEFGFDFVIIDLVNYRSNLIRKKINMLAIKGIYDGQKVQLMELPPKAYSRKKNTPVVVTFLEEEKLPVSTVRAIREMVSGKMRPLEEVLDEL